MTQLGEVFGFDNYEHLEMFFGPWLMKDSTCRLSGIPRTGKTTVIESACGSTVQFLWIQQTISFRGSNPCRTLHNG